MVRVISCVKGTGLNAGYWVITYEDPSRIGEDGSVLSLVHWQVGTLKSISSLR